MLAIRLTPDIEARLNRLTQETGRTKTALAREAILSTWTTWRTSTWPKPVHAKTARPLR